MNEQSPLVPQGSLMEQKNKGRARVKIAVFFVLAVHGIGLLALLMQGCRQEPAGTASTDQTNNPEPPVFAATNPPAPSNYPAVAVAPAQAPEAPTALTAPSAPQVATDYKVIQGDSFSKLAMKYGVS